MSKKRFLWILTAIVFVLASTEVYARQIDHLNALAQGWPEGTLLAATSNGLYESRDEGRNWKKRMLKGNVGGNDLLAIVVDPTDSKVVYASGHDLSVIKSVDGGITWRQEARGLPTKDIQALAIDPTKPKTLHAWAGKHGLYRTKDGARNWSRVDLGTDAEMTSLTSVPIPTGMGGIYLYAGTVAGLFRNADCF